MPLLAGAATLAACGQGPSDGDYAQLVELNSSRVTGVEITATSPADGDWVAVEGTGRIAEDLYRELSNDDAERLCGIGWYEVGLAADQRYGPDVPLLVPGPTAGTPATITGELVAEQGEVGDLDSDGDATTGDQLTADGWRAAAYGVTVLVDGVSEWDLGRPASFYSDFDRSVVLDDVELPQLCAAAADVDPAGS